MQLFSQLGSLLLQHGQSALDAAARLELPYASGLSGLVDRGLLVRHDGRYTLTPQAVRQLEHDALAEVCGRLADRAAPKPAGARGPRPSAELELKTALRTVLEPGAGCPLAVGPEDLDRFIATGDQSLSLALLIGLDDSMGRFSRLPQAKRIAMALSALAGERFTDDTIDVIGFASLAEHVSRDAVPLMMPRPAELVARTLSTHVPLARAHAAPQHLVNLQMALNLAGETLAHRPGRSKAVFVVLDGEPTAFVRDGELLLRNPPDADTAAATLLAGDGLTAIGASLAVFALIDDYTNMDWVDFVDQMTRRTRGVSFYCGSEDLAGCVLESYVAAKQTRPL